MKTLLNLLPEEEKENIQKGMRSRFLLWQLFLLFLLEVFLLSILLGVYMVLDMQLRSLRMVERTSNYPQERLLNEFQEKFRGTNEDVIGKFDKTHLSFTQVFLLLDDALPEGVKVSRLTSQDFTVTLVGKAAKREDVLLLESRLKENECVTKVNIPLSSLFSQQDVDFQVDFEIKPSCLRTSV